MNGNSGNSNCNSGNSNGNSGNSSEVGQAVSEASSILPIPIPVQGTVEVPPIVLE